MPILWLGMKLYEDENALLMPYGIPLKFRILCVHIFVE